MAGMELIGFGVTWVLLVAIIVRLRRVEERQISSTNTQPEKTK